MTIDLDLMPPAPPPAAPTPRRRAGFAAGVTVAVLAVAAVAVVLRPDPTPGPPPPPPPPTSGPLGWVERLVDGPARGALADDREFVDDLLGEVARIIRDGPWRPATLWGVDDRSHDDLQPSLLFADDVGERRIVVMALRLPAAPGPDIGRTSGAWLAGPRGASVGLLTSALSRTPLPDALAGRVWAGPFMVAEIGPQFWPDSGICDPTADCTWLGLAPQECTISTSPASDLRHWAPEPTRSYIVRTQPKPEYWRVTCEGVIRQQDRAPQPIDQDVPFTAIAPAIADADAAGITGEESLVAQFAAENLVRYAGIDLAGPPRLLWTARRQDLPDPAQSNGGPVPTRVVLLAAPSVRSTWYYDLEYGSVQGGGVAMTGMGPSEVATDPADPDAVLATQVDWASGRILALARTAAFVRLVGPGDTTVEAPVVDGLAVLEPLPVQLIIGNDVVSRLKDEVRVVAVDASGTVVGEAAYPRPLADGPTAVGWD